MKKLSSIIILCALWNSSVYAEGFNNLPLTATEIQTLKKHFSSVEDTKRIWQGDPIFIQLPLDKEKRLTFPSHVVVDLKGSLNSDQIRILNNDKSIYITALKVFPRTRLYVTQENGEVILLDIAVDESASNVTENIYVKSPASIEKNATSMTASSNQIKINGSSNESAQDTDDVSYVSLVRFAFAELFAPERILKDMPQYARSPMHTNSFVADLIYGDKVIAHPDGSWIAGGHYVTAVSLQNKYQHSTHINVGRDLCGDWEAATLYPRTSLKPHGDIRGDNTTLILISKKSFAETIGVCHGDA